MGDLVTGWSSISCDYVQGPEKRGSTRSARTNGPSRQEYPQTSLDSSMCSHNLLPEENPGLRDFLPAVVKANTFGLDHHGVTPLFAMQEDN